MLISLFESQSNPPPQVQVPHIPAPILGSLVNQESKPAEGWGTQIVPQSGSDSVCSLRGRVESTPSALVSCRSQQPRVPLARPEPQSLPVPAARLLLAGAAPAGTEVPGWVPSCPRRGPLVVLLQIFHILGLLDSDTDLHRGLGPGQSLFAELGHGWQAGSPQQPRGQASRQPAIATIVRGRRARGRDSAPGRDGGRDPPHAARRAPP